MQRTKLTATLTLVVCLSISPLAWAGPLIGDPASTTSGSVAIGLWESALEQLATWWRGAVDAVGEPDSPEEEGGANFGSAMDPNG